MFAKLRESGKTVAGKGAVYEVKNFTYGLIVRAKGKWDQSACSMKLLRSASLPAALPARDSGASAEQRMGECACAGRERRRSD